MHHALGWLTNYVIHTSWLGSGIHFTDAIRRPKFPNIVRQVIHLWRVHRGGKDVAGINTFRSQKLHEWLRTWKKLYCSEDKQLWLHQINTTWTQLMIKCLSTGYNRFCTTTDDCPSLLAFCWCAPGSLLQLFSSLYINVKVEGTPLYL